LNDAAIGGGHRSSAQLANQDTARDTFNQGDDAVAIDSTDDGVHFPVSDLLAEGDGGGALACARCGWRHAHGMPSARLLRLRWWGMPGHPSSNVPTAMPVDALAIENELKEIIRLEQGFRFQEIAVILAKQKWPDLIASEQKKDLGADAYTSSALIVGGEGKVLACCTTASVGKIKGDATEIKKRFPGVKTLIFATAQPVTNQMIAKWSKEISNTFGYDLVVQPRRDIVSSLQLPENVALCRTLLKIHVEIEPDIADLLAKARRAANDVTARWFTQRRLEGEPLIDLRATSIVTDGTHGDLYDVDTITAALHARRRVVLEAPAGRGKTTTLIQIARTIAAADGLAFLVDLPEWASSGRSLLDYIAAMPVFQAQGLDSRSLARVLEAEPCVLLFNGWNEVSGTGAEGVERALQAADRDFPIAGIAVATRPMGIRPPFADPLRLALSALTRSERAAYLRDALGERADELRTTIEQNESVDALTRTPLILREVRRIFEAGLPLPTTKLGILHAVLGVVEEAVEHRAALRRPPLEARASGYLVDLAMHMMRSGAVTVSDANARAICHATSQRLQNAHQIAALPAPADVLDALCGHHVLLRVEYPAVEYRFEHQQFQEFYAAAALQDILSSVAASDTEADRIMFAAEYVNNTAWEEPLGMVAVHLASDAAQAAVGAKLIRIALDLDPIFAADLARRAGPAVWEEIGAELGARIRTWYAIPDSRHQSCALAAMLASGSPDFSDIVLPLLTNPDSQVHLRTYRIWQEFHLSLLGADWRTVVAGWNEDARRAFLGELTVHERRTDVAVYLAANDASPEVRIEAIRDLAWIGAQGLAARSLASLQERDAKEALRRLHPEDIPAPMVEAAIATYDEQVRATPNPRERLRLLLRNRELAAIAGVNDLQGELTQLPPTRLEGVDDSVIRRALETVAKVDSLWVSEWVARRIVSGMLWRDAWKGFITDLPTALQEEWLTRATSELLENGDGAIIGVLALVADTDVAARVLISLCDLQRRMDAGGGIIERDREMARQLESMLRAVPPAVLLGAIGEMGELDAVALRVVTTLLRPGGIDDLDLRSTTASDVRNRVREQLRTGIPVACAQPDPSGTLLGHLASSLGRIGEVADVNALRDLIQADLTRVAQGREAAGRGQRSHAMRWAGWHVDAVVALGGTDAEAVLLGLLDEDEYELDAARGLLGMAIAAGNRSTTGSRKTDYSQILSARDGVLAEEFSEERRRSYAERVRARVERLMEEAAASGTPERYAHRLLELGVVLAALDSAGSRDLLLTIALLPARWEAWRRADIIETLLFRGGRVPTEPGIAIYDLIAEQVSAEGVHTNQNAWLLKRCLCLLPYFDEPIAAIAHLREALRRSRLARWELRELFSALGHSRSDAALEMLRDLASDDPPSMKGSWQQWIEAVQNLDGAASRELLLGFLSNDELQAAITSMEDHERESLASAIAKIADADESAREKIVTLGDETLVPERRMLLLQVFATIGTPEAVTLALEVVRRCGDAMPYGLGQAFEKLCLERRPSAAMANAYTLVPRPAQGLRRRLFEILEADAAFRPTAFGLLGQIEVWRLEHGRPPDEPRHPAIESGLPWPPLSLLGH
jgi:hypothetical protein